MGEGTIVMNKDFAAAVAILVIVALVVAVFVSLI